MLRNNVKRRLPLLGLAAVLVVIVAATAACSKPEGNHWPHGTDAFGNGGQTIVRVIVPPTNPYNADNDSPELMAATADAVADWNAHPDLLVQLNPGGATSCPIAASASAPNCYLIWAVPDDTPNPIEDSGEPAPGCWTVDENCAFAFIWRTGSPGPNHYLNSNLQAAPNTSFSRIVYPTSWLTEDFLDNASCHENGHAVGGLAHADPVTGDFDNNPATPDTTIQPQGPCVDGAPDRDENPADGTSRGYDWSEVDVVADRGHCDAGAPAAAPRDVSEPDVAAAADSGSCGAQAQSVEAWDGPVVPVIHADTEAAMEALAGG